MARKFLFQNGRYHFLRARLAATACHADDWKIREPTAICTGQIVIGFAAIRRQQTTTAKFLDFSKFRILRSAFHQQTGRTRFCRVQNVFMAIRQFALQRDE